MSTPASYNFSASRITSVGSTAPTIEQPSAIEIAALTIGLCKLASRSSHICLTLATAKSRERLALAWLCSSVAETTVATSATPDAKASMAPRSLRVSATPCAPGKRRDRRNDVAHIDELRERFRGQKRTDLEMPHAGGVFVTHPALLGRRRRKLFSPTAGHRASRPRAGPRDRWDKYLRLLSCEPPCESC